MSAPRQKKSKPRPKPESDPALDRMVQTVRDGRAYGKCNRPAQVGIPRR